MKSTKHKKIYEAMKLYRIRIENGFYGADINNWQAGMCGEAYQYHEQSE